MSKNNTNFLQLFKEKKYSLIVSIIEKELPSEKKTSGLLNLSGVCRMLLRKPNDTLEPAINDFRAAFSKETDQNKLIDPLKNFINASVIFFDEENLKNEKFLNKNFFDEIYRLCEKHKNLFEKNLDLMKTMLKVSKRSSGVKNHILNLEKLIKLSSDPDLVAAYSFFNNYLYDWSQADYLKNSKKINDKLITYGKDKLSTLNKSKKRKINLAFISSDLRFKHSVTYFLKSLLLNYDRNLFNIFIYHNHNDYNNDTTKEFEKYVNKTTHIFNLDDIGARIIIPKTGNGISVN